MKHDPIRIHDQHCTCWDCTPRSLNGRAIVKAALICWLPVVGLGLLIWVALP
jgi:hypothetical protein